MRWVLPALTTIANCPALASSAACKASSAGNSSVHTADADASCTAEGNTSLEDCEALTWSLGCTTRPWWRAARCAITSLRFMFELVPEPVWNTSTGKCSA